MRYETISDAAHAWVTEFNSIPRGIIDKLSAVDPDGFYEVTPPSLGDRCRVYNDDYRDEPGEITDVTWDSNGAVYTVSLDNGATTTGDWADIEVDRDDWFPMYGTMWAFGSMFDTSWLEDQKNLQAMANCGFRIYEQEDYDYIFGIDGCGYDFYEAHWIPLYKARGLHWHEKA